jgi:CelD/BcsL family acetyltransferase involved in cellulose biosynthesis
MKITYDESLQHLSPGNLLMAELISKACDDQTIARIDCVEHASWHHRWSTITEPMFRLVAFNPRSATGLAAEVAWRGLGALGKQPSHLNKPAVVELISPEQVHLPSGRDAKP